MTTVPSFTYAGGELAPGLWGRVDLNKYQTGVKVAQNFHVGVEGGLIKRVGMYFTGKPKYQDKLPKLVPWRIADDDSYMLEVGYQYIRLIRFGGQVLYPSGHVPHPDSDAIDVGGFLEIPTPYATEHARELKFAFANDVAYIFHKNYQPAKLTRLGLYDWDYSLISFAPHESAPTGLTVVWEEHDETANTWGPATGDIHDYSDAPMPIKYKISATMAEGIETLPSAEVSVTSDLGHPSTRNKITWTAKPGAIQYTLYKGQSGLFGFIGYVNASDPLEFFDKNIAPSYDVVPLADFEGFDTATSTGEWPAVGQFYKQRLACAATISQPQTMWFSRPTFLESFSTSKPTQDDDSIKITLVGNNRHTINHLLQLKKFLAFTTTAEWLIEARGDEALTGATIDPKPETAYGSDPFLAPLPIGDRILFVQNISNNIRDMGYEFTTNAYHADDLSRLARHLFENKFVLAWDYADHPYNVVWCVFNEGTYAAMTYTREHEIWGWSRMATTGYVYDVATVPEVDQHATYFLVARAINGVTVWFIERSEVLMTSKVEDLFYVDCGLTYKDERTYTDLVRLSDTTASLTLVGHGLLAGAEVQVNRLGVEFRFIVTEIAGDLLTLATKYDKVLPAEYSLATGSIFICAEAITGFSHLANQSGLVALVDGYVEENITIDGSGSFTLPVPAARVHCGFPYTARVITLDLDHPRAAGQYNYKAVNFVKLHLKDSRGVFAGATAATERPLEEIEPRSDEDYDQPNRLLNGVYEIQPHTEWTMSAGVVVEAPWPLPCHILNIVPDLSYGSD